MATTTQTPVETLAELHKRLGEVPFERILATPPPGTATEADVLRTHSRTRRLCELVDGVLVEKTMGYRESYLAALLISILMEFVESRNLGLVSAPDGSVRLLPGLVRIPDVAFISWERLPDRSIPKEPIPDLVPDLVIEVLSASNTEAEMTRKLHEYLEAGTRLVWYVDPASRAVRVYESPESETLLRETDQLDGGAVLPGLRIDLSRLFGKLDPRV